MKTDVPDRRRSVLVVDDHLAVGEALGRAIEGEDDLTCIGVATSLDGAVAVAGRDRPDVVVVDADLGEADVATWTTALEEAAPGVAVLVVTDEATPGVLAAAAKAGAVAILRRGGPVRNVLTALRTPVGTGVLVDASSLATLSAADAVPTPPVPPPQPAAATPGVSLTDREREVLALLGEGRDTRVIAAQLGITFHTARGYVKSILHKLGAHTQLEAVVIAQRTGILPHPR